MTITETPKSKRSNLTDLLNDLKMENVDIIELKAKYLQIPDEIFDFVIKEQDTLKSDKMNILLSYMNLMFSLVGDDTKIFS